MIDLKRNSKKELVTAPGIRSRKSSIYVANQKKDFKVSRSKFNDFLTCKRCFYLDRVKGLVAPGTPGWTLNETTDLLLKKEFDICRKSQIPHHRWQAVLSRKASCRSSRMFLIVSEGMKEHFFFVAY